MASLSFSSSASALDLCKVVLCLAGNWRGIPACVPPVREALRDMALGRGYPHCNMNGGPPEPDPTDPLANRADSYPTNEETCPVMYSRYTRTGYWQSCKYQGVVTVMVDGAEFSKVFWDMRGDTSTWYSPAAHEELHGDVDSTYDDDLARCGRCSPPPITGPER